MSVYEAEYRAPLWQHGAKPYASEGGGFVFEGGAPVQATSDDEVMRLAISIPRAGLPSGAGRSSSTIMALAAATAHSSRAQGRLPKTSTAKVSP